MVSLLGLRIFNQQKQVRLLHTQRGSLLATGERIETMVPDADKGLLSGEKTKTEILITKHNGGQNS